MLILFVAMKLLSEDPLSEDLVMSATATIGRHHRIPYSTPSQPILNSGNWALQFFAGSSSPGLARELIPKAPGRPCAANNMGARNWREEQ